MQIAYELTKQDFIEAYSVHRNRNAFSKWSRRLFLWIAGLFTAVVLSGLLIKPGVQAAKSLMPLLVSVVMWIAILWILPRHGARTVVLDASGAHWRWDGGSSDVERKNYILSAEGKNQILFYTSPACFNLLPKRVLAAEQLTEIQSQEQQNLQPRK